jgi:hypothetical protein
MQTKPSARCGPSQVGTSDGADSSKRAGLAGELETQS